jgi:hypothetical protein
MNLPRTLLGLIALLVASPALAAVPQLLPVDGYVTDAAGVALQGDHDVIFGLYPSSTGGGALYASARQVPFEDGFFAVALGEQAPLDFSVITAPELWLGITIGSDPEMEPRIRFGTVPFAAVAAQADTAEDADSLGGQPASAYRLHSAPIDYAELANVPPDDDVLGELALSCADGSIARLSGAEWVCDEEGDPVFLASSAGSIGEGDIANWYEAVAWGDHTAEGYLTEFNELDPQFAASAAGNIGEGDIASWYEAVAWGDHTAEGYLTEFTEADPQFAASAAATIDSGALGDWNEAHTWGDHGDVGYLTSYTETDPGFASSPAFNVTTAGISDWNEAHGWGDHGDVGYLTSYTETDPVFGVSVASTIDSGDVNDWDEAHTWGDHDDVGYLTGFTETDPVFGASAAGAIDSAQVVAWDSASAVVAGGLELLETSDARLTFVGSWAMVANAWSSNRLVNNAGYTSCSGSSNDCSTNWILVELPDNHHRALSLSHLDWVNSGHIDVFISVDGGPETLLKQVTTLRTGVSSAAQYQSTMHPLATNLPLGVDVQVRVVAALGRIHFEGMALSANPMPVTIAPRTSVTLTTNNSWATVPGLAYDFTLDRPAVVDLDYGVAGSMSNVTHNICRLFVQRPDRAWYPFEGRSIVGNTSYFTMKGDVSAAFPAGAFHAEVQCRSPAGTISNHPAGNDWQDRYLRIRFPSP